MIRHHFLRASRCIPVLLLALLLSACGGEKPEALVASAKGYLAKGDTKAAMIQLKNALQANVNMAEARYLLGVALLRSGDAAGGEAELRKAREYKHPDEEVVPVLAEAMLALRQYRKLTDEFAGERLESPSAQARLQTAVAGAFAAQNRPDAARESLEEALKASPNYAKARLMQARDQAAQREYDAALANLEAIIAAEPAEHEAWQLKGDVLRYGKRQAEQALAAYTKAVELQPNFVEGHVAILDSLIFKADLDGAAKQVELLKKAAPTAVATKYYEALVAYRKKDMKLATSLSQQLVQLSPGNFKSQQLAGEIALAGNAPVQAVGYLSEAVRLGPQAVGTRRLLVRAYLGIGRPAKALSVLQPMLGDNVDPATHLLAGEVYLQNNEVKRAQEHFAKAAQQDPKNTRARTSLALARLAGGSGEAALGELQEIAGEDKGISADLALISSHLARRDFDKALKAIDALEKKQPDKPQTFTLRARTLLAKRDTAGARKNFERAVGLDAGFFPAVSGLAALDLLDKKPEEARKRFEAMLVQHPKDPQALLALADLRGRSGASKEEVAELINRAVTANPTEKQPRLLLVEHHLRQQDYKQALAAAQNGVTAIPDSPELLDALGRVQQASGDNNQALATFGKLVAMQPESVQPLMRLANANMAAGNKDAAMAGLRKALTFQPDLLDAQRGLIMLAVNGKNFTEALSLARTVQKQRPKEFVGYVFEGDLAAVQKKWDAAVEAYRLGLKQGPAPLVGTKIHSALEAGGKTAEAGSFAANWLRDNPKDADFRIYFGNLLSSKGDYAAAEKIYANVTQMQPGNAAAFNNLAWVSGKLGREGAIALAEKALALSPNEAAYMDTLGTLLADRNDYAKAIEWQTKAVALQPRIGLYRLNLAKLHIKEGKKDLARQELNTLAKLGDAFAGQSEVASLLKSL